MLQPFVLMCADRAVEVTVGARDGLRDDVDGDLADMIIRVQHELTTMV